MCVCVWRERGRGTRRVDKLQGARNNEAPVLGCIPEIGPSRGYKSHGTRRSSLDLKRPIDEFQGGCFRSVARGTNGYNIRVSLAMVLPSPNLYLFTSVQTSYYLFPPPDLLFCSICSYLDGGSKLRNFFGRRIL